MGYWLFLVVISIVFIMSRCKNNFLIEHLYKINNEDGPFSRKAIQRLLINRRIARAKKYHDYHIVNNYVKKDVSKKKILKEDKKLYEMMPKRKNWVSLGKGRYTTIKNVKIPKDSVKKNTERLIKTIKRDEKTTDQYPLYLKKQNKFILGIQKNFINKRIHINVPLVRPLKKKEGEARPLCLFDLESSILLQEANAFLIEKYDCLFKNCSFAFRGRRNQVVPNHHDTIRKILDYREKHKDENIYVTECDLRKFFDTINHKIIEEKFEALLSNESVNIDSFWKNRIRKIFLQYLKCYDFQRSVLSFNSDKGFFSARRCDGCQFGWIDEKQLIEIYGKNYKDEKIGVPQGGALSGFIANLVLDEIDTAMEKRNDCDLLYIRYCDDMIMLHTDKDKLTDALNEYKRIIYKNKLFIHEPKLITTYGKKFYNVKSKLPYRWGDCRLEQKNTVPWISFVGYQIGFNGEVRVREASIKKEVNKQKKVVNDSLRIINGDVRDGGEIISKNKIIRSVILRLQGMSVGHLNLYSHEKNSSLCWANGFKALNNNPFSMTQMRYLDRNRCRQIRKFCYEIQKIKSPSSEKKQDGENENALNKEIVYSGKPFSYYFWLENKEKYNVSTEGNGN